MYSVHECVALLVSCVLVLVVSPEKGSNLLPKCRVFFENFFLSMLLILIMYNHRNLYVTVHNEKGKQGI